MKKNFLSFVLVSILLIALLATIVACRPAIEQDNFEQPVNGAIITNGENYNMVVASAQLLNSDYDAYGISPQAETAYHLTATVKPSNAFNKSIDWTIAWANASSTWAYNKVVTDYVTLSVSLDTLSANVACLSPFGETIVITAQSQSNTNAKATCNIDYVKRVTKINSIEIINGGLDFGNTNICVFTAEYTPFTIDVVTTFNITSIYCNDAWFHMQFVEKFEELFNEQMTEQDFMECFIDQNGFSCSFDFDSDTNELIFEHNSFWGNFLNLGQGGEEFGVMCDSVVYEMMHEQQLNGYNPSFLSFDVSAKTVYKGKTYSSIMEFFSPTVNLNAFYVGVASVSLQNGNLVF